ncbi:MAG: hypothetical protein ACT4P9_05240 [Betaproteobacteria bacterium]
MKALLPLLLLMPLAAPAQTVLGDNCTAVHNAEVAQLRRDARVARRGLSPQADQYVLQNLELLLRDSAMRAERCAAAQGGVQFNVVRGAEKYCGDQANRRTAELERSFSSRNLSDEEMRMLNAERAQIRQEMQACLRSHR